MSLLANALLLLGHHYVVRVFLASVCERASLLVEEQAPLLLKREVKLTSVGALREGHGI